MAGQIITQHAPLLAILFLAYFIRGIAGFGSGLIAMPLLALWLPLTLAVPLVLTLDFIASLTIARNGKQSARYDEIRILVPLGIIGALIGTFLLVQLPADRLALMLGLLAILAGLCDVLGKPPRQGIARAWAIPAGLAGGMTGALFGASAPPYVIYLSRRLPDKASVRATFSVLFLIDGGFRLALFVAAGLLLQPATMLAIGLGLLPMFAGLYCGHCLHLNLSGKTLHRMIGAILLGSGISLLVKSLG